MSTLWTPDGERPIRRDPPAPPASSPPAPPPPSSGAPGPASGREDDTETDAQMAELQELAGTPAAVVVADHAVGLFNLAALHLSLDPPQLDQARVAVDALACLVDGMAGRLGPNEANLVQGLAQLRMAYVQMVQGPAGAPGPD